MINLKTPTLYIKNNHSRKNFLKNVDLIERLIKTKKIIYD